MLGKRIASSVILAPIIWVAAWFSQTPVPWFTLLIAVWALCALYEFYHISRVAGKCRPLTLPGLALALLLIIQPILDIPGSSRMVLTLAAVVPLVWVIFRRDKTAAFTSWVWTLAGIIYLGWLASFYVVLRGMDYGREFVIFALFATFISDSAAYFIGRAFGQHYLAPAISPRKTWEGAVGGVICTAAASLVLQWWLGLPLSYLGAAVLAIAVSVFGQIGDLAASLFKRNAGAKDSSQVIPGHGGFLDRIDSVIFAGLVVYIYAVFSQGG